MAISGCPVFWNIAQLCRLFLVGSLSPHVMNIAEEIVAFKHELGSAIAQWGYVEWQLLRVALECVNIPDRQALAIGYHSVENFRSKLAMCDNLVEHRFGNSSGFQRWRAAKDRAERLAKKRNTIAHGWHKLYAHNTEGRRWAIVPLHHANGQLLHADGEKPPAGALCLRDLVAIRLEFHGLTTQICNAYEVLCGRPAPYPEHEEQPPPNTPSLRQIANQIRAELGVPLKPSRRKS